MQKSSSTPSVWRSTRYRVEGELARGGMGVVYQAFDRLERRDVAIKRIGAEQEEPLDPCSTASVDQRVVRSSQPPHLNDAQRTLASLEGLTRGARQRLALAREFRILSSLRHPHIISVLDYGFDEYGRSYLVMDLLRRARLLADACLLYSLEQRIELIGQVMQALRYLHQMGVVHRDLKPGNVLLVEVDGDPVVKVLDFGLAIWAKHHDREAKPAGTVAYMAPEIFTGADPSMTTDLYAMGVLAYELCSGHHPYENVESTNELVTAARFGMAEFSALPLAPAGRKLVAAMMSPKPAKRPRDTSDALARWCAATGLSAPSHALAIRDSFLRSARFVGRQRELVRLNHALDDAMKGRGSAWLVSGMSGIGKSRLLDEVKAAALVRGMLVLHGQALDAGGHGFAVWHDVLRQLALHVPLEPLEAAVLEDLIDDLAVLLERPIASVPTLDRDGNLRRLARVVEAVFDRLDMPALVVLEDLHWASHQSTVLLRRVCAGVTGRRAILLGSMRSDERPDWLQAMRNLEELQLEPFDSDPIGALCEAIIGPGAAAPDTVRAVQQASGGNAFFIVELLRTLAEEQGGLDKVADRLREDDSQESLLAPASLLARRLARVPDAAREALSFAAVAGRQLDLAVMATVVDDLQGWLGRCAEVSVLEVVDDRWRFSHDKLREQLLAQLEPEQRRALHGRVADALAAVHGERTPAASMAHHRLEAGQLDAALPHVLNAAEEALRQGAWAPARQFAQLALDELDRPALTLHDKARARFVLVDVHYALAQPEALYRQLDSLLTEVGLSARARAWPSWAFVRQLLRGLRTRPLSIDARGERREIWILVFRAVLLAFRLQLLSGHTGPAFRLLVLGHNLGRSLELDDQVAAIRCGVGYALSLTPLRGLTHRLIDEAARVIEQHRDPTTVPIIYEARGFVGINLGHWRQAHDHLCELERLAHRLGDERKLLLAMLQGSLALQAQGELEAAQTKLDAVYSYAIADDDLSLRAQAYNRRGWLALHRGEAQSARDAFDNGLRAQAPHLVELALIGGLALVHWLSAERRAAEERALEMLDKALSRPFGGHAGIFAVPAMTRILSDAYHDRPTAIRRDNAKRALLCLKRYAQRLPMAAASHQRERGRFARWEGRLQQARDTLSRSAELARQAHMPLDHALAVLDLAALDEDDPEMKSRAARARRDLRKRGAFGCLHIADGRSDWIPPTR